MSEQERWRRAEINRLQAENERLRSVLENIEQWAGNEVELARRTGAKRGNYGVIWRAACKALGKKARIQ